RPRGRNKRHPNTRSGALHRAQPQKSLGSRVRGNDEVERLQAKPPQPLRPTNSQPNPHHLPCAVQRYCHAVITGFGGPGRRAFRGSEHNDGATLALSPGGQRRLPGWAMRGIGSWLLAVILAGLTAQAPAQDERTLHVLAWPGYADADVVKAFEQREGARVT